MFSYWLCAIALALFTLVVAVACFVPNQNGYTLPDLISLWIDNAEVGAYMDSHKGERSAMQQAADKGLDFDYGVSIVKTEDSPDVDSLLVAYTNKELGHVPDYIKEMFVDDGWKVVLSKEDLGTRFEDPEQGFAPKKLRGLTSYDDHVIYLDANTYSIEVSAVHEMGHYVDWKIAMPSESDEFKQALAEDMDAFMFYFCHRSDTDDAEMFAETFSAYCRQPDDLAQYCPTLYEYMASKL